MFLRLIDSIDGHGGRVGIDMWLYTNKCRYRTIRRRRSVQGSGRRELRKQKGGLGREKRVFPVGTAKRLTVGLEIFDGHKLGGTGVTLGNGFCKRVGDVFSDRWLE
jgi:hypothetical protein